MWRLLQSKLGLNEAGVSFCDIIRDQSRQTVPDSGAEVIAQEPSRGSLIPILHMGMRLKLRSIYFHEIVVRLSVKTCITSKLCENCFDIFIIIMQLVG